MHGKGNDEVLDYIDVDQDSDEAEADQRSGGLAPWNIFLIVFFSIYEKSLKIYLVICFKCKDVSQFNGLNNIEFIQVKEYQVKLN